MSRLIALRVLSVIPTLLAVSLLIFLMTQLIPGSAATAILGERANPQAVRELEAQLGLDQPILQQYLHWIDHVVTGDFGTSVISRRPVADSIGPRIFPTLSLTVGATVVAVVLGIGAGLIAAVRRDSLLDRALSVLTALGLAVPSFWLALILLQIFAVKLGVLPVVAWSPPDRGIGRWLEGMLLPVISLGMGCSAVIARQTRTAMIEALEGPYVKTLRALGTPGRTIVLKYALKNATAPILTVTGFQVISITAVGFIVERVYSIPGLGTLMVQSVNQRDIPVVQATTILVGITVVAVYLAIDITIMVLNPKVRTH